MTELLIGLLLLGAAAWLVLRRVRAVHSLRGSTTKAFQQRLLAPDWALYAAHLQRAVPPAFIVLYRDYALLLSTLELGVYSPLTEQHWLVTEFFALDAQALEEQKGFTQPEGIAAILPFGTCSGNDLFLAVGATAGDQIWLYMPARAETIVLFDDIASFSAALAAPAGLEVEAPPSH
jgi:hypothetical protein